MTMIESMASGTPVIARRRGAVDEVLIDGVTGFICETDDEMVEAIGRVGEIDRKRCRQHVEQHFSAETMTSGYEMIYERLMAEQTRRTTDQVIAELLGGTSVSDSAMLPLIEHSERVESPATQT
jgi:hypothetical protein